MNVMVPPPIQRSADHRYTYEKVTYPGTTDILRVLDKSDGLIPWAANETAKAATGLIDFDLEYPDRYAALERLLAATGPEGLRRAITDRHRWQRDEAAQLGSEVHRLAEEYLAAPDMVIDERYANQPPGIRQRVSRYAEWWQSSGWSRPLTEVMGVNPSVGYGGTLDLLARDADGRLVLADIKTGKGVYREAILQLAAYGNFTVMQYPQGDEWKIAVMPTVDRYVILHVTLDGVREVELTVGNDEVMAFLDCVDLHRWTQKVKGRL